ncbi:UvrB/UvrC motif-containing protein [bacterium]|nr:UvrB/UvrC motif-containing protein [bacterium]
MDPSVEIRSAKGQVDDLLGEINKRVNKGRTSSSKVGVIANRVNQSPSNNCRTEIATPSTKWCSTRNDKTTGDRVLVTTLTKRMSEELTEYYREVGVRVKYMHSGIDSLERNEIIRDLRLGKFDVLIGINLLREGLDLPEVSLVAILDADKEGFLRSKRSLIQTFGRASRNVDGHVILYADKVTDSMKYAIDETNRRRKIQGDYNKKHRITPETIKKSISDVLHSIYEADYDTSPDVEIPDIAPDQIPAEIERLRREMFKAAEDLDFELAAELRDKVNAFENIQLK